MSEKTTGRKQAAIQWLKDNNTYLILLVMIIVSAVISNNFLTAKNLGNLVKQNSIKIGRASCRERVWYLV